MAHGSYINESIAQTKSGSARILILWRFNFHDVMRPKFKKALIAFQVAD
jgi:hypothetical protein